MEIVILARLLETLDVEDLVQDFRIKRELASKIVEKRNSLCFIGVDGSGFIFIKYNIYNYYNYIYYNL